MPADVLDVADAISRALEAADGDATTMKLQKLLYYAQAWHLADTGEVLFDAAIEAWEQGPVVPAVFGRHRGLRRLKWCRDRFGYAERLTPEDRRLVDEVVRRYGRFTAEELRERTHRETPWREADEQAAAATRRRVVITAEAMRSAFRRGALLPETSVELAVANSRIEGLTTDPATVRYLRAIAVGEMGASEAIARRFAEILGRSSD